MNYWIYDQIKVGNPDIEPMFALQSSINWIKALSYEIKVEHGNTISDQMDACRTVFSTNSRARQGGIPLGPIFSPLFHSLIFSMSLVSMYEKGASNPWMFSSAVVTWYYAIFNSFKSILASNSDRQTETHGALIKAFHEDGIRTKLPHPFNMVAIHIKGEDYATTLPNFPRATSSNIVSRFDDTRATAQGMLIAYMNGTANREVELIKERLKSEGKVINFRSKEAKAIRDKLLPIKVNIMNCAFRYRGKANYRDSIFVSYGRDNTLLNPSFIENLANVAKFSFVTGLAYAERRVGRTNTRAFINDINAHLRGLNQATTAERFWSGIQI
ncbi:MAG TPA: hypothetical protein VEF53_06135 [Patescibacteria group bacterium]|nr:hypothetical protein [Patescibacteria group bacterium]